jgi:hypothetical protein
MSIYVYLCLSFRRDTTPIEAKSQTEGAYIIIYCTATGNYSRRGMVARKLKKIQQKYTTEIN